MSDWNISNSRELFNVDHWGEGYFDLSPDGAVVVRPNGSDSAVTVDLHKLASEIQHAGLALPVLVRFPDILQHRVSRLCDAFDQAMHSDGYTGQYTAVYPIKVNQQRSVVEALLAGADDRVGLEAGSKPELMVVLALSRQDGGVVVCNGYKDREYIRLALIGAQLGHRVFIVVEKLSELNLVIEEAANLDVQPTLGLRVRLASIAAGKWQNTGGDKSKFGLSAAETLRAVERLRESGLLSSLQMLHFHMGSQVSNIRDIQKALREAARYFTELHALGAPVSVVDIGGGLGVDYEGTASRSFCSINYGVQEYANNAVHTFWETCEAHDLPHPHIITESGRAMTAHHAVLITNVIESECVPDGGDLAAPTDDEPHVLHDLWNSLQGLTQRTVVESYHEAAHWMSEAQVMYTHGVLDLAQRARAEQIYFAICWKARGLLQGSSRSQRELYDELSDRLADKYFCNFSVFQSLPDIWAIDQIFPIMPLQRLHERPERRAVLADITCDSDGRIDHYVQENSIENSLPMHALRDDEPYLIGIFMAGAYQEILGDIHNLFGDTDSINVLVDADGTVRLDSPLRGDTVDAVLRQVRFEPQELRRSYHVKLAATQLSPAQRDLYRAALEAGLHGYTYLED